MNARSSLLSALLLLGSFSLTPVQAAENESITIGNVQDWENLVAGLDASNKAPAWFTGFEVGLAPHHRFAAMQPADRQLHNETKRPLMVFPEISMYRNHPGMLVKKDYWKQVRDELNSYDPALMKGGWPYAERWKTAR